MSDIVLRTLDWSDDDRDYEELLVGRTVKKISDLELELDDGTILEIVPNWGCSCGSGDYGIDSLNECDNVITSVKLVERDVVRGEYEADPRAWDLFVFADNQKINLLSVSGDDGNGYYGTGFTIQVKQRL